MIRAALQPLACTQQFCSAWLGEYFRTYGDQSPNSAETKLSLMNKIEVYEAYKHEFQILNSPAREVVNYCTFNQLWNNIYPFATMRPYVDIPGKCDTCYEIDRLRRTAEDKRVQVACSQAHVLHRGGLFMLERHK